MARGLGVLIAAVARLTEAVAMGIGIALLAMASPSLAAERDPICADRPGAATPACTVPQGMVQVEMTLADWTGDRSGASKSDSLLIGASSVKVGLSDRLHIQLDVAPYAKERVREGGLRETVSGFGDLGFALKYRLTRDGAPVEAALFPYVKIPTAKRPLGNGKVEGGVIVPVNLSLPGPGLSLALSPQLDIVADGDGSGHHLGVAQVLGLGFPLGARLSGSAEFAGYWDFDPARTSRQYVLAGSLAYLVSEDFQLDAGATIGLNRAAPDLQLYSGIAFRF